MSGETLSTHRQIELIRELERLAAQRFGEESRIRAELQQRLDAARQELDRRTRQIEQQFEAARGAAQSDYENRRSAAAESYEAQRRDTQQQYQGYRSSVETRTSQATQTALAEQQEVAWETWALFDAQKDSPRKRLYAAVERLKRSGEELAVLERDAADILKMRRVGVGEDAARNGTSPGDAAVGDSAAEEPSDDAAEHADGDEGHSVDQYAESAADRVEDLVLTARGQAVALYRQKLPRLYEGWNPVGVFVLAWLMAIVPCGIAFSWTNWLTYAVSGVAAIVASAAGLAWLYPQARRRAGEQYSAVQRALATAREAIRSAAVEAKSRSRREAEALLHHRNTTLTEANDKLLAVAGAKKEWKESELSAANTRFPARLAELRTALEQQLGEVESEYRQALSAAASTRDRSIAESQSEFDAHCQAAQDDYDKRWQQMADRWRDGLASVHGTVDQMQQQCRRLFPDWAVTSYGDWRPPDDAPAAIRFGQMTLDVAQVPNGRPDDPRLMPDNPLIQLPALMNLREHPVMVIDAEGPGRDRAVDILELMLLRLLTAMPPGKIRMTILDPVGLGESFATFMHLADFDERLIASRIWTESKHINEQLVRLTTHMETILQKYLRNEFATIHEYNEHAGEVAEPFQILVVANFPANFSDETARRLVSIATSGPRCGVYTLLGIDRKQRLPNDFRPDDLLAEAVHLDWQANRGEFVWRHPALENLPLAVDALPPAEPFIDVVRQAGRAAKSAIRVEVPFTAVAPTQDKLWSETTAAELVVPIGRAGATRLQSVRLGKGTSQHLLICGKTGSGKSTFLHALITNAALRFTPDELEFYLVDFKKGVEFKCYATAQLPHARVIAIESEREFGLSVLEKLDDELRRRGELFRSLGVQDLPAYRAARPDEPMPRVLLVIDEFQELFVEDDKLAQDAGLLLDRLVRQGRAFGMHVLLGSQTLSGAYSLARSTMGQMAVRVALQCSEADAHLILNDERNPAARYLSRPGEAIYNDQNGLLVGNHPFQVVWLSESERFAYLDKIRELQTDTGRPQPLPIVFEGNAPADPANNRQLAAALENPSPTEAAAPQKAWLGAAVAITDPTAATFARHAGSNLLVVGHREESTVGVLTTAVISLAASGQDGRAMLSDNSPSAFQFFVLDGTRPESPEAGTWQRVADALPAGTAQVVGIREAAEVIHQLAAELARREVAGQDDVPPIYLVIYNGGRFRDLRRSDDDFSFSVDRDKPPSPDKQLAEILKNGPAWGIHTLLWCDSYNNVTRMFDRMTLREFEMRVVFQMSAADSTSLLDSPAAAKLVVHRGLFYSDETGTAEKFRPYGPPTDEWLATVQRILQTV